MHPDTQLDLMELPALKKAQPKCRAVNLWLPRKLKAQATKIAFDRYEQMTLSQLVAGLLIRECSLKRGLLKKAG